MPFDNNNISYRNSCKDCGKQFIMCEKEVEVKSDDYSE